ncbi:MAG: ribonuclease Z, partial [Pseudomonadota bacterium]
MKIVILGSGTAAQSLERNASSVLVVIGDLHLLVDIGPGTMRRLCEAGIDARLIDAILLTHFHPDHVSDLVAFLFASNYGSGPLRQARFTVIGPTGLKQFLDGLVEVYRHWIVPTGDRMLTMEMNSDRPDLLDWKGATIRSTPAVHSGPSLSYRIEADGASVTFSGDTDVCEGLVDLAHGTDLLVCECSMP